LRIMLHDVSAPSLLELGTCLGPHVLVQLGNISFSKAVKACLRTGGLAAFLASSISVLLAKGRSQCVMSTMWRNL